MIAEIKKHIIILAVGLFYLAIVLLFDFRIPCLFYTVTGFLCPACGITRMFSAIAKLDFAAAFSYNPVVFVTIPVLIAVYVAELFRYIKSGERKITGLSNAVVIAEIVILIIYGIIRNL